MNQAWLEKEQFAVLGTIHGREGELAGVSSLVVVPLSINTLMAAVFM